MPKTDSDSTLVIAGEPGKKALTRLRSAGEKLTGAQIAEVVRATEEQRATFQGSAVRTGIFILAKRLTLKHGEWQPFCAEVWTALHPNRQRAADLTPAERDNFARSLRDYAFLAQHFIADLEQGAFAGDGRDAALTAPAVEADEVLALALPSTRARAITERIEAFVGGRSLRRMLQDFRRAESASDTAEAKDATEPRPRSTVSADSGGSQGELDLWRDLELPLTQIKTLFADPVFVEKTDRDFWERAASELEAQMKHAKAKAKEIKG